jgi:hypothetical protein
MISEALLFLYQQLDSHFGRYKGSSEDLQVVTRPLVDQKGESTPGGEKGVSLTLVNIEEEIAARRPYARREISNGFEIGPAALNLNLSVLVTAEFKASPSPIDPEGISKNYGKALQCITRAVEFFHSHPCFTPADSPDLPDGIEKLIVHQVNLSIQDQQNLWAYLGAKYLPSVLYKVSMVSLISQEIARTAAPVSEIDLNLMSR